MRRASRILLALIFVVAGTLHFVITDAYLGIMPPYLPWHRPLVLISGVAEIAGGVGLLHPRTRRAAAMGLVLLLLAVWPANWQMALDAAGQPALRQALLWLRVPLQLPLMLWVWWASRPHAPST